MKIPQLPQLPEIARAVKFIRKRASDVRQGGFKRYVTKEKLHPRDEEELGRVARDWGGCGVEDAGTRAVGSCGQYKGAWRHGLDRRADSGAAATVAPRRAGVHSCSGMSFCTHERLKKEGRSI